MLFNENEVQIMARSSSTALHDPHHQCPWIDQLIRDFLDGVSLDGKAVLDIGPGQWDFGAAIAARGAAVHGFDHDPAIVELGRARGYQAWECNVFDLRADQHPVRYDGLFTRGALNPFQGLARRPKATVAELTVMAGALYAEIVALLKPDGWGLIWPFNHNFYPQAGLSEADARLVLEHQRRAFLDAGFTAIEFDLDTLEKRFTFTRRYVVEGRSPHATVYLRNLPIHQAPLAAG